MMIKHSQLPGVKTLRSMRELFAHVSDELAKFHQKAHANLKQNMYIGTRAGAAKNVNNRR
jgi:cytochrome b involved in lipid metabolism